GDPEREHMLIGKKEDQMAKRQSKPADRQPIRAPARRADSEHHMSPKPKAEDAKHRGSGKLAGKVALITGGDSGIGRAVAIAFAKEGADIAIVYLKNDKDAEETKKRVEEESRRCVTVSGDVGDEEFCRDAVK